MLKMIREMWRDDGAGRLLLLLLAATVAGLALTPLLVWRDHVRYRGAAARFDACARAGGTVAVSTNGDRWCVTQGAR